MMKFNLKNMFVLSIHIHLRYFLCSLLVNALEIYCMLYVNQVKSPLTITSFYISTSDQFQWASALILRLHCFI